MARNTVSLLQCPGAALMRALLSRLSWRCLWVVLLIMFAGTAGAHEIRPAYLEVMPSQSGWQVLWKQPVVGDTAVALQPVFSGGWLDNSPAELSRMPTHLVKQWRVTAAQAPLEGQTITIVGLERTITDTLVHIRLSDGNDITRLLTPDKPSMLVETGRGPPALAAYLVMGMKHTLLGFDHLLFVLGLLLLVRKRSRLLWTLTAFTLAHSITLALSALQIVQVSVTLIEAAIALSILFVAVEVVNLWRGEAGLASRWPWGVAFAFGLLHGFGFASAFGEVGLPKAAVLPALLLFNLGVEIGQLAFVAAVLSVYSALRRRSPALLERGCWLAPYAIGGLAGCWCIERIIVAFT
jgi:hydrogenase/urease accessory protein HupE